MYVSVDHEKLCFLHKHPDYRVVANLDFIANRSHHCSSFPLCSVRPFEHFTLTELQGLCRNTTGKEPPTGDKETLEEIMLQLARFLPDTECDAAEVERQASDFEDKFPNGMAGFSYVRGANTPGECEELAKLTTPRDPVEVLAGARQSVARKQLARQAHYNRVGVQPIPSATPTPREGGNARNAGKPAPRPRSGVCGLIHDLLDKCYKETGLVPTREQLKAIAVEKGWNASTAGVQYGAWRKQNNLP
jgi:hypothetical protein